MATGSNLRRGVTLAGALLVLAAAPAATAAVAPLDAFPSSPQLTGTTGNMSGTFTVSAGSNRLLVVTVQCYDSGGSSGQTFAATYGGRALTQAATENSNRRQTWIGYLDEPGIAAAGNTTLSVTITGTHTGVSAYVASYSGVDQTTPITATGGRYINNTNGVTVSTASLAVNAGGYGLYNWSGSSTRTSDNESYTEHADVASGGVQTGVASKAFATTTTTNPTVTWSANTRASVSFVTLNPATCTTPTITTQPVSSTICSGSTATLTVAASGSGLSYQWYQGTAPSTTTPVGTNSPSFTTPSLTTTTGFWVRVSNACGPTNSATATVSIDAARPAAPTGASCTGASSSQINLTWTNPVASFAGALVVRGPAGGAAPTFVPVDGTTYATGAQGADYVVAVGNVASTSDTGLAAGTTYAYRIYAHSSCRNYSSTALPTSCSTIASPNVTTSVPSATVNSCTQITVSAPFTGDSNANSSTTVERGASSTGPWTAVCSGLTGASPRTCVASGLTNATSYWFRVTFADADGIIGTNPQVIGSFTTQECRVTPGTPSASATSCSTATVTAPFTGDANGNGTATFGRGTSASGPFTTVCSAVGGASPKTCSDTGLTASTTYYYQVTFADADGVSGTNPQVTAGATTPACSVNNTTIGAVAATVASCTSVRVTATFTGDGDQDGTTTVQYGPGAAPATWTDACVVSGPSPRQCTVPGLTASTLYSFRALFADPDGVVGTNPTTGTPSTTTACGADVVAPTVTLLAPSRNAVLSGIETVKVQVWDAVGVSAVLGQVDGTGTAGFTLAFSPNANYSCGSGCAVYQYSLPAQAAGSHYLAIRATDAAGNVAVVTVPFRAVAASTGAGNLLRRTSGSQLCLDCHNLQTHNSQHTSTAYGNWSNDCATCHTPHATKNIALVREQIETPNSGRKAVDFRASNGVAANGHATPQASGNGVNVCEVCHTRTKNSDGTARARNNSPTDWTKHYTSSCTGCHSHAKGFAAGESEGGVTCKGCHKDIWDNMQAATARTSRHTLAIDTFTDDTVAWGNPLSSNAAAVRSCLNMCHHDHPHTAGAVTTHENNVYKDAATSASRAATTRDTTTKAKTDFDNAATNGGLCISCHLNPVETAATGLPAHPAVPKAAYNASAHNYTTNALGTWQYTLHDGSRFDRNCTKCHAGRTEKAPGASAIPFQAVHWSDDRSLLAGTTNPGTTPASFVCYNCHGNGTIGSNLSNQDIATQVAKTRNHPASNDAVHDSITEYNGSTFGAGLASGVARHASCLDCHEPHAAKAGSHAVGTAFAGPPLEGSWGAQLSSNPAFWTAPASANFTKKTIVAGTDLEATLCFKCHSSYYGTLPSAPSGGAETDTAREFNPSNAGNWTTSGTANAWSTGETAGGFHPVLATAGSNLGAVNLANLVTTSYAWSTTARNRMACSDCHGSNATADPMGPHGSTASYILRGPNTTWSGSVVQGSSGMPAGTFCANCHSSTFTSSRFAAHYSRGDHQVACWNCHAAIPHGGPRPGMLIAPAGAAAGVGGAIAGWDTTAPYWGLGTSTAKLYIASYPSSQTGGWGQSNCGCNGTNH